MSLFVDASVWSLALRRTSRRVGPKSGCLVGAVESGETLLTADLVL